MARRIAALWLLLFLVLPLQQQAAAHSPGPRPAPTALGFQGRTYRLGGLQGPLEVPLACAAAQQQPAGGQLVGLQVPAEGWQRCSAALTVLQLGPDGLLSSLWTRTEVRGEQGGRLAATACPCAPPASPWGPGCTVFGRGTFPGKP